MTNHFSESRLISETFKLSLVYIFHKFSKLFTLVDTNYDYGKIINRPLMQILG